MPDCPVTVVLPCLNEAASLPGVLAAMPEGYQPLVVDNNSTDGTADVARRHGADVVAESRPGYGSAVHAGVVAATTPIVAVIDADGSLDPHDLPGWSTNSAVVRTWRSAAAGRFRACAGPGMRGWVPRRCVGGCAPATACRCTTSPRCGWRTVRRCSGWESTDRDRAIRWNCWSARLRGLARGRTRRRIRPPHRRQVQGERFAARQCQWRPWTSGG